MAAAAPLAGSLAGLVGGGIAGPGTMAPLLGMQAGGQLGSQLMPLLGGSTQTPQVAPAMSALQARPLGNIPPPITSQSVAPVGNIVSGSGGASSINNPQIQALLSRLLQAGGTA